MLPSVISITSKDVPPISIAIRFGSFNNFEIRIDADAPPEGPDNKSLIGKERAILGSHTPLFDCARYNLHLGVVVFIFLFKYFK